MRRRIITKMMQGVHPRFFSRHNWPQLSSNEDVMLRGLKCGVMWPHVARCGSMWLGVAPCGSVWFHVARCGPMWLGVVPCGLMWFRVAWSVA